MLNFLADMGNYEDRCVALFENGEGIRISTARCSDGQQPYETAIQHPDYKGGDYVIVEAYDTKDEASEGHTKWVAFMITEPLPEKLVDCCNAGISQMCAAVGSDMEFVRKQ